VTVVVVVVVVAVVQELEYLLAKPVVVGAELQQDPGGHVVALADEAEQDVLGADSNTVGAAVPAAVLAAVPAAVPAAVLAAVPAPTGCVGAVHVPGEPEQETGALDDGVIASGVLLGEVLA
jgi:hypothetical protein